MKRYRTILADPPWPEVGGDVMFAPNQAHQSLVIRPFKTMDYDQIRAMPIEPLALPKSHLYLWATQRSLREAFSVMEAWGFEFKAVLTWCKTMGLGFHYFRHSTEFILFGVRGKLATRRRDVGTWFEAKRGKHHLGRSYASKPETSYQLIESCSSGPFLELFARRRRAGWHVWGNEVKSDLRIGPGT